VPDCASIRCLQQKSEGAPNSASRLTSVRSIIIIIKSIYTSTASLWSANVHPCYLVRQSGPPMSYPLISVVRHSVIVRSVIFRAPFNRFIIAVTCRLLFRYKTGRVIAQQPKTGQVAASITHVDDSVGIKAFSGVCVSVFVPHDKTQTAETTITKFAKWIVHHESSSSSTNIRSKVKGKCHRVTNCRNILNAVELRELLLCSLAVPSI